jgi:hypothetical protein
MACRVRHVRLPGCNSAFFFGGGGREDVEGGEENIPTNPSVIRIQRIGGRMSFRPGQESVCCVDVPKVVATF